MRRHLAPAPSPQPPVADPPWSPTPSPAHFPIPFHPTTTEQSSSSSIPSSLPPSKFPIQFSPPLIVMVVIIATALLFITYSRLISRYFLQLHRRYLRWDSRRHNYIPSTSTSNIGSPSFPFDLNSTGFHSFSPGGLGDAAIKAIPLSTYRRKSNSFNCTICLLEFKENDSVRTLPICSHAFHVECVDTWLRSHANCPLCRASILRSESPFLPVMSNRIRPSFDDLIIQSPIFEPSMETPPKSDRANNGEITEEPLDQQSEHRFNGRNFLLKRSYSFGFERNIAAERLVVEPVTASPWRYRRGNGSFWNKRPSPFSSLMKPRVFSFRSYRGIHMKSPFSRRRSDGIGSGFFPLSESSAKFSGGSASAGGGCSSRRSYRSFASPIFMRSSAAGGSANYNYSSSRLRSGDPEALLSPDRYSKRWNWKVKIMTRGWKWTGDHGK